MPSHPAHEDLVKEVRSWYIQDYASLGKVVARRRVLIFTHGQAIDSRLSSVRLRQGQLRVFKAAQVGHLAGGDVEENGVERPVPVQQE